MLPCKVPAALFGLALSLAAPWSPAAAAPVKSVVIVHGAFADGSGWRKVSDILTGKGYAVSIVQQPLTSLADDVAATRRVLSLQTGPAVLVGHSYGGMVISEAGNDSHVAALVYVAAFEPDKGALVVVPSIEGRRGNPVVWSRRFFPDLMAVQGDVGARHIIASYVEAVVEVPASISVRSISLESERTWLVTSDDVVTNVVWASRALLSTEAAVVPPADVKVRSISADSDLI